jgi:glycosyltransferase 2 family protein
MKTLTNPKVLLSLAISGAALAHVFYSINISKVLNEIAHCDPIYLALAILMVIGHLWIRALRWKFFLPGGSQRHKDSCSTKLLFDGLGVSNFCNYLLPLRSGELIRAWFVSRNSTLTIPEAVSTVVVERLFDLIVVLLSFTLLWWNGTNFHPLILVGAQSLSLAALVLAGGLVSAIFYSKALISLAEKTCQLLPQSLETLKQSGLKALTEIIHSTHQLSSLRSSSAATGLSLLAWATNYASIYFFLGAVDIPVTATMAVTAGVIIALAVAAPALPGFIGVYQWASIAALGLFDVDADSATAFSLLSHAVLYALYIGYGLWILNRYTLSFRSLTQAANNQ